MTETIKTVSKFGISVDLKDFTQKAFEAYQVETVRASRDAYFAFSETNGVTATAKTRGETVRAAIRHEIIDGLTIEKLEQLKPYVVQWLANEIRAHVIAVVTPPLSADPN